ncbi:MAG TPA: DUF4430 domain-containing protein [Solirubrobacteraceae bacterium]|jgi:hypothetical protein|nr:DUF4430 domain-containing protein [Solirubrobacteraceae bacterium]
MSRGARTSRAAHAAAPVGHTRLGRASLLVCVAALLLASCGFGPGSAPGAVKLTVTRGFGAATVGRQGLPRVRGQETVMSLLMRNHRVKTRYGGGFVQAIDGRAGGLSGGDAVDWFYYVNGVEAPRGAAETDLHPGDHVWWDLHDWSQTGDVPAVVGSFPEPFLNGIGGKRLPVRVECSEVTGTPCQTVLDRLRARGVPAAVAGIGPGDEPDTLRVLVGPWLAVGGAPATQAIVRGPSASGVYARFAANGQHLTMLDAHGRATHTMSAGAGLIAATRYAEEAPVWVVTGVDVAGVARAAAAFDEASLRNRFALALEPSGAARPVPTP